jgi:hypothetical protein
LLQKLDSTLLPHTCFRCCHQIVSNGQYSVYADLQIQLAAQMATQQWHTNWQQQRIQHPATKRARLSIVSMVQELSPRIEQYVAGAPAATRTAAAWRGYKARKQLALEAQQREQQLAEEARQRESQLSTQPITLLGSTWGDVREELKAHMESRYAVIPALQAMSPQQQQHMQIVWALLDDIDFERLRRQRAQDGRQLRYGDGHGGEGAGCSTGGTPAAS